LVTLVGLVALVGLVGFVFDLVDGLQVVVVVFVGLQLGIVPVAIFSKSLISIFATDKDGFSINLCLI